MASLSYCGIDCSVCAWREKMNCKTCKPYKGDIWHGSCAVAKCCIGRSHGDCGQCGDFPCKLLVSFAFDQEHGDGGERIANLCRDNGLENTLCGQCCGVKCVKAKEA